MIEINFLICNTARSGTNLLCRYMNAYFLGIRGVTEWYQGGDENALESCRKAQSEQIGACVHGCYLPAFFDYIDLIVKSGLRTSWHSHKNFVERQLSEECPIFYVGCPGGGANHCLAITPAGAAKILRVDAETFPNIFDAMLIEHSEKLSGLYTLSFCSTRKTTAAGVTSTTKWKKKEKKDVIRKETQAGVLDEQGNLHKHMRFLRGSETSVD